MKKVCIFFCLILFSVSILSFGLDQETRIQSVKDRLERYPEFFFDVYSNASRDIRLQRLHDRVIMEYLGVIAALYDAKRGLGKAAGVSLHMRALLWSQNILVDEILKKVTGKCVEPVGLSVEDLYSKVQKHPASLEDVAARVNFLPIQCFIKQETIKNPDLFLQ